MKKILCVLCAAVLLLGVVACTPPPAVEPDAVEPDAVTEPLQTYSVYFPNDSCDGFNVETVSTEQITAEGVLIELKNRNVLPDEAAINSFSIDDSLITVDFNQGLANAVRSMGSSGEVAIMGSVVNTFLDAFGGEYVCLTVDGQALETGHEIYDYNLSFYSYEQ